MIQTRGYLDALTFTVSQPGIEPDRIALRDDSFTGG